MMHEGKREAEAGGKAGCCRSGGGSEQCCQGSGRCWLWIIGGIVLLFLTFHIGWYAALKYQATAEPVGQGSQE